MLAALKQLVTDVDGAWAAALGGLDGLLIDGHSEADVDLTLLVAEHAGLLRATKMAYEDTLSGGVPSEWFLRGETLCAYIVPIRDFFLLMVMDGRGNLGQARLYSQQTLKQLEEFL
ncbi:roadblock/LC7 domain-containing protein [Deinococcus sp.]|uniref:roadblock/LC7 domain-containing protein n=1 Tax=Deinococcus sp. TaxID=47478 RepID=UPI003B5C51C9